MTAALAWRVLILAGLAVAGCALVADQVREWRADRCAARELAESLHLAEVRAAAGLLERDRAQSALDDAYALAEQQALAAAETGQGWQLPSRELVASAVIDGKHDEVPISLEEVLTFAAIAADLRREERPRLVADTDPDPNRRW